MPEPIAPRIFLAHAHEDQIAVSQLYDRLQQAGYRPWLDKRDLIPGQNWRVEIPKAIKASAIFVACLSQQSIAKRGYIQKEFKLALVESAQRPANEIYVIPLRLDDCDIPDLRHDESGVSLRDIHWLDYFQPDGFEQLKRAIDYASGAGDSAPVSAAELTESASSPAPEPASQGNIVLQIFQGPVGSVGNQGRQGNIAGNVEDNLIGEVGTVNQAQGDGNQGDRGKAESPESAVAPTPIKRFLQEKLPNDVLLDMVYIPDGRFFMGSPKGEEGRDWCQEFNKSLTNVEGPQHRVKVPAFYMGKYPVTQAQWYSVALLDDVDRALQPSPSYFKGKNRPVEQVSWDDAVEFCKRLSKHTNRDYRLPSESEWEYACRARTTTPFYFGETLWDELANYCAQDREIGGKLYKGAYGAGKKGQVRKQTTEVGIFPPNDFSLYDMHGNVWE